MHFVFENRVSRIKHGRGRNLWFSAPVLFGLRTMFLSNEHMINCLSVGKIHPLPIMVKISFGWMKTYFLQPCFNSIRLGFLRVKQIFVCVKGRFVCAKNLLLHVEDCFVHVKDLFVHVKGPLCTCKRLLCMRTKSPCTFRRLLCACKRFLCTRKSLLCMRTKWTCMDGKLFISVFLWVRYMGCIHLAIFCLFLKSCLVGR